MSETFKKQAKNYRPQIILCDLLDPLSAAGRSFHCTALSPAGKGRAAILPEESESVHPQ